MKKIKLFTDLSLLRLSALYKPVDLLLCFLDLNDFENNKAANFLYGRFDEFQKTGKEFVELTRIEECDACLLPLHYPQLGAEADFEGQIQAFVQKVEASGKATFVFLGSDVDNFKVKIRNSIIFHYSLYESKRRVNEYAFNSFNEDFIKKYYDKEFPLVSRPAVPSIGFCGYAPPLGQKFGFFKCKEIIRLVCNYLGLFKIMPSFSGHTYRVRALLSIIKSKNIRTNLIIRQKFAFGGPFGALFPGEGKDQNLDFREQYIRNIIESEYVLCVRGYGNYSNRFYEALCCGRIPVFVNTNCVLPYDFIIDWKKYTVWIEEKDLNSIEQRVLDFHNGMSDSAFRDLQLEIRNVWLEYISPQGFYKNLHKHLNVWHASMPSRDLAE